MIDEETVVMKAKESPAQEEPLCFPIETAEILHHPVPTETTGLETLSACTSKQTQKITFWPLDFDGVEGTCCRVGSE